MDFNEMMLVPNALLWASFLCDKKKQHFLKVPLNPLAKIKYNRRHLKLEDRLGTAGDAAIAPVCDITSF